MRPGHRPRRTGYEVTQCVPPPELGYPNAGLERCLAGSIRGSDGGPGPCPRRGRVVGAALLCVRVFWCGWLSWGRLCCRVCGVAPRGAVHVGKPAWRRGDQADPCRPRPWDRLKQCQLRNLRLEPLPGSRHAASRKVKSNKDSGAFAGSRSGSRAAGHQAKCIHVFPGARSLLRGVFHYRLRVAGGRSMVMVMVMVMVRRRTLRRMVMARRRTLRRWSWPGGGPCGRIMARRLEHGMSLGAGPVDDRIGGPVDDRIGVGSGRRRSWVNWFSLRDSSEEDGPDADVCWAGASVANTLSMATHRSRLNGVR